MGIAAQTPLGKSRANRMVLVIERLEIAAGEIAAGVGPVGGGKMLLIKLLSGLISAMDKMTSILLGQTFLYKPT